MNDTRQRAAAHLSHDMECYLCGHARHTYLPCSDTCDCVPPLAPGLYGQDLVQPRTLVTERAAA